MTTILVAVLVFAAGSSGGTCPGCTPARQDGAQPS
jgi:hypothetical protein